MTSVLSISTPSANTSAQSTVLAPNGHTALNTNNLPSDHEIDTFLQQQQPDLRPETRQSVKTVLQFFNQAVLKESSEKGKDISEMLAIVNKLFQQPIVKLSEGPQKFAEALGRVAETASKKIDTLNDKLQFPETATFIKKLLGSFSEQPAQLTAVVKELTSHPALKILPTWTNNWQEKLQSNTQQPNT